MKNTPLLLLGLFPITFYAQKDSTKINHLHEVEISFQRKKSNDLSSVNISTKNAKNVVNISGGVEGILKMYPGVNSNTELSSQYMVRGGNYDENLIYINDIEIYRPFLIRNSQQEGLSIINPDMVDIVNFSAGGFEAKYGDKMSSALNIYYRQPTQKEFLGEISLIGGRLTNGFLSRNKKLSAISSVRYRNTNLILNTLNEETDFNPQYIDFQTFINYNLNEKWKLSFLGFYSKNTYEMVPKQKSVEFGSLQNPIRVDIAYAGKENDSYQNMLGTLSLQFSPNKKWIFSLDNFAYQNREREYYTIHSGYKIQAFDPINKLPVPSYDIGGQSINARNDLSIKTLGTQLKVKFHTNKNSNFEAGLKYEKEILSDLTNEWQYTENKGYVTPQNPNNFGILNDKPLNLQYNINGKNYITPTRLSAYLQYSQKLLLGNNKIFINAGIRGQKWNFNNETLISPRVQFAIKPNWEKDMLFRIAGGVYYQAPFYKEIKNLDGDFNPNIKAQKSYQIIIGNDYEFEMVKRPFKLTTEIYYKKLDQLIPYYIDNVRTRYAGENNSQGYSYGIDARLFGHFVPGVDSFISASYARVFENINGQGYIPRPTDQRVRFSIFYQDYMPKFPSMKINLTLVYSSGLPTGSPIHFQDGKPYFSAPYSHQQTLPTYKRVDIGLSKTFIDEKNNKIKDGFWSNFKELILGVQIFNAFNINNTIANQWISDVSSQSVYAVPIRLTGRFFNIKLDFKL